ncbi:hypothetical protein [Bacillus massilioanorexius]|uniref:hypothetical protein n=2 Tax=Bacillus TaxID=1386 RepID=UPI00037DA9AC|nr:hypothetical protein [Bacillus massilioanorexius]
MMFFFGLTACFILVGVGIMLLIKKGLIGVVFILLGLLALGLLIYYYSNIKRKKAIRDNCFDCGSYTDCSFIDLPFRTKKGMFHDCGDGDCSNGDCGCGW